MSKISKWIQKLLKRCWDRGLKLSFVSDPKEDKIRTKKELQGEVNDLYTGDQIASHFVYAQNYTYLWCVMTYSCGLPILYPMACLFYVVLYWVYKFLLLKFYSKTTKFNEELPLFTVNYIRLGLIWHVIASLFMISNTDILMSKFEIKDPELWSTFADDPLFDKLYDRFAYKPYVVYYLIGVVLIFMGYILQNTLVTWLYTMCKCIFTSMKQTRVNTDAIQLERDQAHSNDFFKDINIKFLMDQFEKTKNDIKNAPNFDDKDYHQYRFDEEVPVNTKMLEDLNAKKLESIKHVVDDHMKLLYGPDSESHEMSTEDKLDDLFRNENEIFKARDEKELEDRLRMDAVT